MTTAASPQAHASTRASHWPQRSKQAPDENCASTMPDLSSTASASPANRAISSSSAPRRNRRSSKRPTSKRTCSSSIATSHGTKATVCPCPTSAGPPISAPTNTGPKTKPGSPAPQSQKVCASKPWKRQPPPQWPSTSNRKTASNGSTTSASPGNAAPPPDSSIPRQPRANTPCVSTPRETRPLCRATSDHGGGTLTASPPPSSPTESLKALRSASGSTPSAAHRLAAALSVSAEPPLATRAPTKTSSNSTSTTTVAGMKPSSTPASSAKSFPTQSSSRPSASTPAATARRTNSSGSTTSAFCPQKTAPDVFPQHAHRHHRHARKNVRAAEPQEKPTIAKTERYLFIILNLCGLNYIIINLPEKEFSTNFRINNIKNNLITSKLIKNG